MSAATRPIRTQNLLRAFRVGLKSTGFTDGQNVAIEYRWAEGRNDKLPELTADLVGRQVAVIVAPTTPSVLAAKAATKTIPIVFFTAGDPVDLGLVASLSRPDSNLTGATTLTLEVGPKWLQLMHEMVPNAKSLALLINPTSPNLAEAQSRDLQAAARSRGLHFTCCEPALNRTSTPFSQAFPTGGGRTCDQLRFILLQPERSARRAGCPSCGADDFRIS